MSRGISETLGGENQTAGYSSQLVRGGGQMRRGLFEPLKGEIQTSRDTSATAGDTGLMSVG